MQRRKRAEESVSLSTQRVAHPTDESGLRAMVDRGKLILDRFSGSIAGAITTNPAAPVAPEVAANPEDMPCAQKPDDTMLGCIRREVH